jgi:uncharacterized protein YkwD
MKQAIIIMILLSVCLWDFRVIISCELVTMKDKLALLDSMNKCRTELGLKKVKYSVGVEKLAKIRTKTIYNHLKTLTKAEFIKNYQIHSHEGFWLDELTFSTGLKLQDSRYLIAATMENVCYFMGYTDNLIPKSFEGWKNSEGHWSAMMSESINHISLHYEKSDIGIIAVMILFQNCSNK